MTQTIEEAFRMFRIVLHPAAFIKLFQELTLVLIQVSGDHDVGQNVLITPPGAAETRDPTGPNNLDLSRLSARRKAHFLFPGQRGNGHGYTQGGLDHSPISYTHLRAHETKAN